MLFSGFCLFLFIRRHILFSWIRLSQHNELPVPVPLSSISIPSNNITELLLEKNITNSSDGMDIRSSRAMEKTSLETSVTLETICRNRKKLAILSFLEDPNNSDLQKKKKMEEPSTFDETTSYQGFRMEAGGFWKDWSDAIFLFLQ